MLDVCPLMARPSVENLIVTSDLGKKLELTKLGTEIPGARYVKGRNSSVMVELETDGNTKPACVIVSNGKAVVVGTKTIKDSRKAMSELKSMIKKVERGINSRAGVKIENIVTQFNVGVELDLDLVNTKISGCEYQPDKFSGLLMKVKKPEATYILFKSGIVVITDINDEKIADTASRELRKFLREAKII